MKKSIVIFISIIILIIAGVVLYKISCKKYEDSTETFYAMIEEISEYNGNYSLLVKGLEVNDINGRGEFSITVKDTTKLIWRGTKINITDLKVGQNISITYDGMVLTSYPGQIPNVLKIKLLNDEI